MIFEFIDDAKKGQLKVGMTRDEVRKIFSSKVQAFKKTPICKVTSDDFYNLVIHAFYDDETNKLEGLEIFQPNRILIEDNVYLLGNDYQHLLRILTSKKIKYEQDLMGVNLKNNKLRIYVPHADERVAECACVYVDFKEGCSLNIK
ncbi:hypothetical protein [Fluviispira vulneris]|uniref:hypothetical protein n=1 Tax=Fluviispira vulneris TaxID=2763012 RepID=UPI001649547E|nr:hypothetical protein [Fluviispira vulneris]